MPQLITAALAGFIFGLGLILAQMINPAKVLSFLDLAGQWDPSLALVMVGAISTAILGVRVARGRPTPIFAPHFPPARASRIDLPLIGGAVIFGMGWGMAGLCPGPAIAAVGTGSPDAMIFAAAMIGGMAIYSLGKRYLAKN
jgi:uncharacterized membrane protein YedE/YeeE